jgi:hypothetical protein
MQQAGGREKTMVAENIAEIGIAEAHDRQKVKATALRIVEARFTRFQPVWVEKHLAILCALRAQFGADIDKAIILAVIGQRMMRGPTQPDLNYEQALRGGVPEYQGRFTNIESIAAASGIPRETVRRKIAELQTLGWVSRGEGGELHVTTRVGSDLDGITKLVMELSASVFEAINHELQMPDADSPSS